MRIDIEYSSCWQNSFLNNETSSSRSNTRKFNKSKPDGNLEKISKNTLFGVLHRLIGDQRALNKIKQSDNRYFFDIGKSISFKLINSVEYDELVMLINKSNDRASDGKYIGIPKDDIELFSDKARKLWSALYLSPDEVINFINNPILITSLGSSMPRDILNRIEEIQTFDPLETMEKLIGKEIFKHGKQKERIEKLQNDLVANQQAIYKLEESIKKIDLNVLTIEGDEKVKKLTSSIIATLQSLKAIFPEIPQEDYLKKGGEIQLIKLYGAALYLQAELMIDSGYDLKNIYILQAKGPNNGYRTIQGFSRKGFNGIRDFINPLSTGGTKKTVKTPFSLTKASGKLEITLDIDRAKAKEIKQMINDAGVSSFYLGKKGLAYVTDISTREVRT